MAAPAGSLASLLQQRRVTRIVGARDPLTAILAEQAGFDAVWLSSLEASATRGLPDLGLLTMTECHADAVAIRRAVSIPTLVDCDTGYGGNINVRRTVREFAAAGTAGICIEDKVFPKRNSLLDGHHGLMPREEFAEVIAAAVCERGSSGMLIVARLESLVAGKDTDDALARAHAYADAGADAVLVHSKSPVHDDVVAFLDDWGGRLPTIVVPTTYNNWTVAEAERAGVAGVIYANHGLRACIAALRAVFARILEDGCSARVDKDIAGVSDVFALTATGAWDGTA